jgi:hypothetical protein
MIQQRAAEIRAKLTQLNANTCYVGIDPGADGAIFCFSSTTFTHVACRFKDLSHAEIAALVRGVVRNNGASPRVGIEEVRGFPQQSAPRSFNFGYSAGVVLGAAIAAGAPVTMLPKTGKNGWASLVGIPLLQASNKKLAVELATEIYPQLKEGGKVHEGVAEAALIATALALLDL